MTESMATVSRGPQSGWQRFWFQAEPDVGSLYAVRCGLSLIAIWYFASHWIDAGRWFAGNGILATERLGDFLDAGDLSDAAWWRVSPLYLIGSTIAFRAYLLLGILIAVANVLVHSSRIPAILLWLWCVWLANRSLLIAGPEDLALVFGLAYLVLPKPNDANHWTTVLACRMIQVHTTMLLTATGLTMLASKIWWDGTGSVSIAAPVGRRMFDLTDWLASPWFHELLTHAIVFVAIAASILIWFQATRWSAYLALTIWCIVLAMLSSQWMYLVTIVILLQCFRPKGIPLSEEVTISPVGTTGRA